MKADAYGTMTQQRMYLCGYLTPAERDATARGRTGCSNCREAYDPNGHGLRCGKYSFAVRHVSCCNDWAPLRAWSAR